MTPNIEKDDVCVHKESSPTPPSRPGRRASTRRTCPVARTIPARRAIILPGRRDMADVRDELARLTEASTHDLRIEWRRPRRAEPPVRLSRDLPVRGVAYDLSWPFSSSKQRN